MESEIKLDDLDFDEDLDVVTVNICFSFCLN